MTMGLAPFSHLEKLTQGPSQPGAWAVHRRLARLRLCAAMPLGAALICSLLGGISYSPVIDLWIPHRDNTEQPRRRQQQSE